MGVKKLIKNIKKIVLLSGILFSLLLISSFHPSFAVIASAAETDVQNKTIEVLNAVIGINTTGFVTDLNSKSSEQYQGLQKNVADMTVISTQGQVRVSGSFVENNLHQIYICNYEGNLAVENASSDTVEMARTLLGNYENYVGDPFYGQLESMLDNVDGSKNTTKSEGNVKLDVKSSQTITTYLWTYVDENGIIAKAKKVLLSYENGQLKVFRNDWPLYSVVNAPIISSGEAIDRAIEATKTFSYEVYTENGTSTVTGFEIAHESLGEEVLSYLNHPNQTFARGGDPFLLYPSWFVSLGFVKSYPGAVTGMTTTVWADTGEISSINPVVLNIPSTKSTNEETISSAEDEVVTKNEFTPQLGVFSFLTFMTVISLIVALSTKRRFFKNACNKLVISKLGGILFCSGLLFSAMLSFPIIVSAEPNPNSVARIYAALEGGGDSPPQLSAEQTAAYSLAIYLEDAFDDEGYTAYDMAGNDTDYEDVEDYAEDDEDNYDHITVFHFGHQSGFNTQYVDNAGNDITASNIDNAVDTNKYEFVFIFVCAQAQSTAPNGMAAAWTNRTNVFNQLSSDGYGGADAQGQCYIGFDYFSPMISLVNGTFCEDITGPFKNWVEYLYEYALDECYTINGALDKACLDYFGVDFDSSILTTGYNSWWPGNAENGTHEFPLNKSGYYPRDFAADFLTLDPPVVINEENKMRIFGDGTIGMAQPWLTVSAGTGGWVSPSGSDRYTHGYQVMASAQHYTNYDFSHWNLDGQYYSSNQVVTVNMYDDHSLQAIFTYNPPPPPTYQLTVYCYDNYGNPGYVSLSIDGQYVGTTMNTYTVTAGSHTLTVPYMVGYHTFAAWYRDGGYSYSTTTTINVNSNEAAIAYYAAP